jgi:NAD(P)-dependent dehydrogenase (short-subunit alcohol dehydrogenase family)
MTIAARHALVTGGSRGIGRGIALKLADHGVHVAINYLRDEASAKATLEQIRARGADGFTVQADVSQPSQIERLFGRVRDEFGSLDIFVANARTDRSALSTGRRWPSASTSGTRR